MTRIQSRIHRALVPIIVVAAALVAPAGASALNAPSGFLGVSANNDRPANAEIDRMGRGNVGILRININWGAVEPKRPGGAGNPFQFSELDRVVGRAAQAGVELLPILYGTPSWLAGSPNVAPIRNSEQRTEWARFLRAMVGRYGPNGSYWDGFEFLFPGRVIRPIRDWQVWNEPTTNQFFKGTSKRKRTIPHDYADLLKLSASAIRGVDPSAKIITAGVFGTPHVGRGLKSRRFFRTLFSVNGIAKTFDGVALHPYAQNWRILKIQLFWALRELRASGLKKRLWITEVGWPTGGKKGDFQDYLKVGRNRQAKKLKQTFKRLIERRNKYRLERVFWFTWRDRAQLGAEFERCNLCKFAGLFDESMAPKPAWFEFTRLTGGNP